mmetsp:Transcript_34297/g.71371  ORF Transcript_34297/g.71371 Transcript_34297/m.71371 type:complete len:320 (-) Transcript_34297:19-978(-)
MLHLVMWPLLLSLVVTSAVQHRQPEYNRSELSILIPEARPLVSLPLVALQAHTHFPELQVQLLYGQENDDFVHNEETLLRLRRAGSLVLTPLPLTFAVGNLTKGRYSTMLKCPEFWESALTPKILLVQADSWLCNSARASIKPFLGYDYVGSPWGHLVPACGEAGGNGGLSLRDKEAMLRVARMEKNLEELVEPEDVFFCSHAGTLRMPPSEEARRFATEEKLPGQSAESAAQGIFGVHKLVTKDPNGFSEKEVANFEEHCPGVTLMVDSIGRSDTSPNWRDSEDLIHAWRGTALRRLVLAQTVGRGLVAVSLRDLKRV